MTASTNVRRTTSSFSSMKTCKSPTLSRNRDLVLFDDAIYGRSYSRLLTFSDTNVADVIALGEQTQGKTPGTSLALA
jgi:hypothetical protein